MFYNPSRVIPTLPGINDMQGPEFICECIYNTPFILLVYAHNDFGDKYLIINSIFARVLLQKFWKFFI